MIGSRLSLRVQLALMGAAAILVPLVVVVIVVFATQIESNSSVEIIEEANVEVVILDGEERLLADGFDSTSVSNWVPLSALGLGAVALGVVWLWAGRAVRPLKEIAQVADEIQAGSLDERLDLGSAPAEVERLGRSFDRMLDRLDTASTSQSQLIEDTSHELRTPLAALAGNVEVMLNDPAPTLASYREGAERTQALIDRVQASVDGLLFGARARTLRARQVDNDLVAMPTGWRRNKWRFPRR